MNSERSRSEKEPLLNRILEFRRFRSWLIAPLMIIGILGLALPIFPGIAFIFAGLVLWKPELADKMKEEFVKFYKNFKS